MLLQLQSTPDLLLPIAAPLSFSLQGIADASSGAAGAPLVILALGLLSGLRAAASPIRPRPLPVTRRPGRGGGR